MSEYRDYEIGNRRGYVHRRHGKIGSPPRIVIEVGSEDFLMTMEDARDLQTLIGLLLREAGAWPPVWMPVLAHNPATAGALCQAFDDGWEEREHWDLYAKHGYRTEQAWAPGCGKAAP